MSGAERSNTDDVHRSNDLLIRHTAVQGQRFISGYTGTCIHKYAPSYQLPNVLSAPERNGSKTPAIFKGGGGGGGGERKVFLINRLSY